MGGVANDWSIILILCGLTNLFAAIDSINVDILNCLENTFDPLFTYEPLRTYLTNPDKRDMMPVV